MAADIATARSWFACTRYDANGVPRTHCARGASPRSGRSSTVLPGPGYLVDGVRDARRHRAAVANVTVGPNTGGWTAVFGRIQRIARMLAPRENLERASQLVRAELRDCLVEAALPDEAPGSDRYYWFRGPEARVALTAPEPLRFVTANPGREMFCGIGVSGRVYCANDRQYRCDRVAVSSNGELVRREDVVGPASWIGVGPDHVCVVVDGEGWCWGENLLGPSPQRVTIDPELGPCLDVAVPLRLPIPES
jgi:hypothetical protein